MPSLSTVYKKYKVLPPDQHPQHPFVRSMQKREAFLKRQKAALISKYLGKRALMTAGPKKLKIQKRKTDTRKAITAKNNLNVYNGPANVIQPILDKMHSLKPSKSPQH